MSTALRPLRHALEGCFLFVLVHFQLRIVELCFKTTDWGPLENHPFSGLLASLSFSVENC